MMSFERAEKFRANHPRGWPHNKGDKFGWFEVKRIGQPMLRIQAYEGGGDGVVSFEQWDHVSVSTLKRTPTWEEMDFVKRLFFDDSDTVVQFHVPREEHVNVMEYCLHLWRWRGGEFPRPSRKLV